MTKVFLLGSNSFIARELFESLKNKYIITSFSRQELDIKNKAATDKVFRYSNPEIVINCAVRGCGRETDTVQDFYDNLLIIENLLACQKVYPFRLVAFSSGAEFNGNDFSNKYYGFSKYIQTKRLSTNNLATTLRIFNVFGPKEKNSRFISTCIRNCQQNKDIIIEIDKQFDFFSIQDLSVLINHIITNKQTKYQEFDCVYPQKLLLSEVAALIVNTMNSKSDIMVKSVGSQNYIGDYSNLKKLKLNLLGLRKSLENQIYES